MEYAIIIPAEPIFDMSKLEGIHKALGVEKIIVLDPEVLLITGKTAKTIIKGLHERIHELEEA